MPMTKMTIWMQRLFILLSVSGAFFWLTGCKSESGASVATPALGLPGIATTAVAPIPPVPTLNPTQVVTGQAIYERLCAECHGANLEGQPDWKTQNEDGSFRSPPHDASGHTWHHGDNTLIEAIKLGGARLSANIGGTSNMPAFEDTLTDEEITAVLSYIKSTWPEETRQIQWEQTVRESP